MSEWIGVEDRLPDAGQNVIAHSKSGGVFPAQFNADSKPSACFLDLSFASASYDCAEYDSVYDVDFWMPLPEKPNQA